MPSVLAFAFSLYKGELGPVLTALRVETNAEPADPDVATF